MRLQEIDIFRGLWAVSVMLMHFTTFYQLIGHSTKQPLFYFPWFSYRVQFFCMISGFVIAGMVDRGISLMDFVVTRAIRLYPMYFIAVVASAFFAHFYNKVTLSQVLFNLTMFQSWFNVRDVQGSFWYVAPLLSFYIIICGLFLFKKLQYLEELGMLSLVGIMLVYLPWPAFVVNSELLFLGHFFYAGMVFYYLRKRGDAWFRHAALAICFVIQILKTDDFTSVLSFGLCLILFYLLIYNKLKWIINKPLLFLGSISYSLYLIHMNMGLFIIQKLSSWGANAWLRLIVPVTVSILAAAAMTYWIERPLVKYMRTRYEQWKQCINLKSS